MSESDYLTESIGAAEVVRLNRPPVPVAPPAPAPAG